MVKIKESTLRISAGSALWMVSGVMTFNLFLTLSGPSPPAMFVAGVWALGLEAGKALSWRRGGWWRLLSVLLSGVTLFSVVVTTMNSFEDLAEQKRQAALMSVMTSTPYSEVTRSIEEARGLVSILTSRMTVIPGEFTTGARETLEALTDAKAEVSRLESVRDKLLKAPRSERSYGLDVLDGGWILELVVSVVVFLLTEATALSLMGRSQDSERQRTSIVTPERYLKEAKRGAPPGRLRGRAEVAKSLGVSERQVRYARERAIGKASRGVA